MNLTKEDEKRLRCYTIRKSKDADGCGTTCKIIPLSGARIALNVETDYRIAEIRLDEFTRITGFKYGTACKWAYRKFIKSRRDNGHRWLDVESTVEFLKDYHFVTLQQREAFDERLIEVYDKILAKMTKDTEDLKFIFKVL